MKVTHQDDFDTHAVIGGNNVESFEIAQTAEFFTVLSSTLYSNKPLAVIREVLCNAWDAHIASGRRHIPIKIELSDSKLSIRDFGLGIPHDKIHRTYCVYGNSTKENDGRQTGGFGLGSKAPFAYSDHFTVTNHHEGLKVVHAISRGSTLTQGKPDRRVMVSVPTDESGIEVSIPLNEKKDQILFQDLIHNIAAYGEMNVHLNGASVPTIPISQAEHGFYLTKNKIPNTDNQPICVRYGNVIYPVPPHKEVNDIYHKLNNIIDNIQERSYGYFREDVTWKIIIQAAPNTISVTPSRESISMTETTINTLNSLMNIPIEFINRDGEHMKEQIKLRRQEAIDQHYLRGVIDLIPIRKNLCSIFLENEVKDYKVNELKSSFELSTYYSLKDNSIQEDDFKNKIQTLINGQYRSSPELKLMLKFMDFMEIRNKNKSRYKYGSRGKNFPKRKYYDLQTLFKKKIQRPLMKKIGMHPILSHKKLFDLFPNEGMRKGMIPFYRSNYEPVQMLAYLQKVVIITYSRLAYDNTFKLMFKNNIYVEGSQRLIYVPPRTAGHREAAIEFFTNQGFNVIDHASWHDEYMAQFRTVQSDLAKVPVIKSPSKPDGLLSLENLWTPVHGTYDARGHLDNPVKKYTTTYEAVIKPYEIKKNAYRFRFFEFGDNCASNIVKYYGNRIGIVASSTQYDKQISLGKRDALDLIMNDIHNEYFTNDRIRQIYTHDISNVRNSSNLDYLIEMSKYSSIIKNMLAIPEPAKSKDKFIINLYDTFIQFYRTYYHEKTEWGKKLQEIVKLKKSWVLEPKIKAIQTKLSDNDIKVRCLNFTNMTNNLREAHATRDYSTKSYIEICIINALN